MNTAEPALRLAAALEDRYAIERALGAGGMATVYLASDLKHDRKVAIKVLKPELAAVLGAERFVQEIKTTAALSHPHILPLFDSGEAGGFLYYVMPYIDGETIRDRLNRENQLGVGEAVRITCEIADALDYAHRQGVIHRDIKPENLLLHDGRAMVMDFGIALAVSAAAGGRMTETGLSLGTPHYMSPEQATADRDITARSDIYSLASVCYEMLAGDPPHTASSAQAIIMKIVTEEAAAVTTRRKSVPPHVADALATALEKLPADRFATAADFASALQHSGGDKRATARGPRTTATTPRRERLLAATLALAIAVAGFGWLRDTPDPAPSRQQVVLWNHQLPDPLTPGAPLIASQVAIAPDGSSIVYVDSVSQGYVLMLKRREAVQAEPIEGTEGGVSPFYSPDGAWIGFLTMDRKVRKVPVAGGGVITLGSDVNPDWKVGTWSDDDHIYYSGSGSLVARLDANAANQPSEALGVDSHGSVVGISPLPGSRGLLVSACPGNCAVSSSLYVLDTQTDSLQLLVSGATGGWYAPTGHLLYTGREGGLFAMTFDVSRLTTTSSAVPVIGEVAPASFALSVGGDAIYARNTAGPGRSELVWSDRDGNVSPFDSTWQEYFEYPSLSPDGRTLAVSVRRETTDLWLRRPNGGRQQVIAPGSANWRASWTADGDTLYFVSVGSQGDPRDIVIRKVRADLGAEPELAYRGPYFGTWEVEITPDGASMVLRADREGSVSSIWYRSLTGDTTLRSLVDDGSNGNSASTISLSPDGRWLAYFGDDLKGSSDVYVAPFPSGTPRRLVSRGSGSEPRWSRDGRELYFKSDSHMMAVRVGPGPGLELSDPQELFSLEGYRNARNRQQYDVAPDGRFLLIRDPRPEAAAPVVYAQEFLSDLRAVMR